MTTQTTALRANMNAVGCPPDQINWYWTVALPRNFEKPGDAARASAILRDFYARMRKFRNKDSLLATAA